LFLALLIALIAVLVLAVVAILGVFAWVLLAPLVRQRGSSGEPEADADEAEATVLFGRPMTRSRRRPREPVAAVMNRSWVGERAARPRDAPATIPMTPALSPPPQAVESAPETAEPDAPPADVLVVTSDAALSDCQLAILAASGCASRCVATASDAVGQLRIRIPDLMLVDAAAAAEAVPLVAAVRAWRATEFLPVVLFTPNPDADVSRSAAELGVTDVVVDAPSVPGLVERALPYWLVGVGVFSSTFG
jgi:CheY-like chemotaxis protein